MTSVNQTIRAFGYPDTLIAEFEHWLLLVRPAQPTLGSLILAAKGDATAFGDLPPGAHAELKPITAAIEAALAIWPGSARLNYLMLMMVDPHVHFHVIPRYEGARTLGELEILDAGWPGPPDLKTAINLDTTQISPLAAAIRRNMPLN
jgi:diadenosine tetraphosphate (Ap4A) HIT family hydrolase